MGLIDKFKNIFNKIDATVNDPEAYQQSTDTPPPTPTATIGGATNSPDYTPPSDSSISDTSPSVDMTNEDAEIPPTIPEDP